MQSSVLLRSISTSASRLAELTVSVPSMGESITEGAVATILKKPGKQAAEWGSEGAGLLGLVWSLAAPAQLLHKGNGCAQHRKFDHPLSLDVGSREADAGGEGGVSLT